jgi:hypothetical protein
MDAKNELAAGDLAARVDELADICARLARENAELRDRVTRLSGPPEPMVTEKRRLGRDRARRVGRAESPGNQPGAVSRRMIGKALGAAAAGAVGAAVLMDRAQPAAANSGQSIDAGVVNTAEDATTLNFDGSANPGVVFLANDTLLTASGSHFPAALAGWAGTNTSYGVYGFTLTDGAAGVIGQTPLGGAADGVRGIASASRAFGVRGTNSEGTGVAGSSDATADNATAVLGTITSSSPGNFSAAVKGENNGTKNSGIGVWGDQMGSGWGVYGTSARGVGVNADGGTGTGVAATGNTGVSAFGTKVAVTAEGPIAVRGSGLGPGSRGGTFSGAAAQLKLNPGTGSTHPTRGQRGDLYADKTGRLWYCKKSGNPATWHQIA